MESKELRVHRLINQNMDELIGWHFIYENGEEETVFEADINKALEKRIKNLKVESVGQVGRFSNSSPLSAIKISPVKKI